MKNISRKTNLSDVIKNHPDIKELMIALGFKEISKPGMLKTMGKIMTIEKGARLKNLDLEVIEKAFEENGYKLI